MDEPPAKKRKAEDIAESSNRNSEINMNFQLKPAIKLKQSIAYLSDPDFNPKCRGLLEFSDKGFEITVRNSKTEVAANLFLNSSGLINFHCSKPIFGKMINLHNIFEFLLNASDDDTITVFHLDGSISLSFQYGDDPATQLNVGLLQMNRTKIEKFPEIKFFCEAVLSSEILREMIQLIQFKRSCRKSCCYPYEGAYQPVSVEMSEGLLTIFIGLQHYWQYRYADKNSKNKVFQMINYKGMAPGQKHHAWFLFPHLNAMQKASFVAPHLLLRYLNEPSKNIVMRFSLRDLGHLVLMMKALKISTNLVIID